MRTKCIKEPANQPMIVIKKWQLDITNNNHCAAALLSFYQYWHEIKVSSNEQQNKRNRVAEFHGDEPSFTDELQYHTQDDLIAGLLGLFGKTSIIEANKLLVSLGYITIHRNPSPKYKFDKTNYFHFEVEKVQNALDMVNTPLSKNRQQLDENRQQLDENNRTITEITTEITTDILEEKNKKVGALKEIKENNYENDIKNNPNFERVKYILIQKGYSDDEIDCFILSAQNFSYFAKLAGEKLDRKTFKSYQDTDSTQKPIETINETDFQFYGETLKPGELMQKVLKLGKDLDLKTN